MFWDDGHSFGAPQKVRGAVGALVVMSRWNVWDVAQVTAHNENQASACTQTTTAQ